MSAARRRDLVSSRRRVEDEGEDDDLDAAELDDFSQSELSVVSDKLDAGDSEASDFEGAAGDTSNTVSSNKTKDSPERKKKRKSVERKERTRKKLPVPPPSKPTFTSTPETQLLMNDLEPLDVDANGDSVNFDDITPQEPMTTLPTEHAVPGDAALKKDLQAEKGLSQDEAKAKRETDPTFVPNRGGFFMHDHRSNFFQSGYGRGRGRGRGLSVNSVHQPRYLPNKPLLDSGKSLADPVRQQRWDHDLHDTSTDEPARNGLGVANIHGRKPSATSPSRTISVGTVTVRVLLPEMKQPRTFEKVTVKQHTRLPDLRPPLRRDKPVRVALPDHPARYIFPVTDRSFIFIPRAQRPNQQGARSRGRGYLNHYGSRRNSVYGGSAYTPSVAMSRRSSQARDGIISPAGSIISKPPLGATMGSLRPVVKLPNAPQQVDGYSSQPLDSQLTQTYPLPSEPQHENQPSQIPMHQPRPQKTVSLATIETPGQISFHAPPQQEQQPFHNQIPLHINGQAAPPDQANTYSASQQSPFPGQPSGGTPLSVIPERAVNAQPFQPTSVAAPAFYPPPNYPMYYYPPPDGQQDAYLNGSVMHPPMFMQGPQQGAYMVPMLMPPVPAVDSPSTSAQPGLFAHESNGMVYYYDSPQIVNGEGSVPSSFAVPGAGGIMTPGPEGYYYSQMPPNMVYYAPH